MKIALLTGGISTERNVALRSAENMASWCQNAGYEHDLFDLPKEIDQFLWKYKMYDLVIPVFHGRYWEDGIVTGLCETLGLRVAGSSSAVHALCIDKFHTNCIVEKIGIKVPKSWIPGLPIPAKLLPSMEEPSLMKAIIIKPNQWGSSLATTKVRNLEEFESGIRLISETIESLTLERNNLLTSANQEFVRFFPSLEDIPLVQECIEWREFTVWVYSDMSWIRVLPIIEIMTLKWEFFDYAEKYETDGSNEVFSELNPLLKNRLEVESSKIYEFLRCRWVIRIDWRYDGEDIYFLEVNTIPGFTSGSLVPKMWKKAGKSEKEFVEMLSI